MINILLLSLMLLFNLSGCNSIGNVVPQKGASMEQVYDGMGKPVHHVTKPVSPNKSVAVTSAGFQPAQNPLLHLYVYPHRFGEMPMPGYETEFSAYEKEPWIVNV